MENENVMYFKDSIFDTLFDEMRNRDTLATILTQSMCVRTLEMFEWKGLPTTIPQEVLEAQLQMTGKSIIFKHKGNMFACYGNVGGLRNYNYMPLLAVVSNPYLDREKSSFMLKVYYGKDDYETYQADQVKFDGDCVVIPNDGYYLGLRRLNQMYATELADNKITRKILNINARAMYLFSAATDDQKSDFEDLMESLEKGDIKAILDNDLLSEAKTLPFADNSLRDFTSLIENEQYIKASWFNDLGLQANYNMKREAINSNESQLNKDAIIPLTDNMLSMRKKYCEKVNELFGTNWSVDFSSAWKQSREAMEEALEDIDQNSEMSEDEKSRDRDENSTQVENEVQDEDNT